MVVAICTMYMYQLQGYLRDNNSNSVYSFREVLDSGVNCWMDSWRTSGWTATLCILRQVQTVYQRAVNTCSDNDGTSSSIQYTQRYLYLSNPTTMETTKRRRALTILEKQMICQKRQKPEHIKEKFSDFGNYFLDDQGLPVSTSILSDILKEKEKWLILDTESGSES